MEVQTLPQPPKCTPVCASEVDLEELGQANAPNMVSL